MKNKFLGKLVKVFAEREIDDFPPEVSDNTLYSYNNFRGSGISSLGPRDESGKENERESDVYTSPVRPQVEFCRQ